MPFITFIYLQGWKKIPTYSSDNETKCFDFYKNYDGEIYINGKSL